MIDTLVVREDTPQWRQIAEAEGLRIFISLICPPGTAYKVDSETITTTDLATGEVRYPFRFDPNA